MRFIYILIALLLAVDNIFINFKVGGISYDRLLAILLFFYFFKTYLLEVQTNPFFKKWNIFLFLFALVQLLMNFKLAISDKIEFVDVYTDFIKCFSFLVFSFLFLLIAKKDIKYINIIILIHVLICIFAILQHPMSPIASQMHEIKKGLYSTLEQSAALNTLSTEEAYISSGFESRFRLSGPFASSISFSYFAITSFILTLYIYLRSKKKIYLYYLCLLFIASILSQTRSLLLAEICLILGFLFFAPFKNHGLYKLIILLFAVLSIATLFTAKNMFNNGSNSRITSVTSQGESDIRPWLWFTGLYAIVNHPFGITKEEYLEVKKQVYRQYGRSGILYLSAHNGLINIGFHYSFVGYIIFFFLVQFLLQQIKLLDPEYVVFFRLVLIAYLIHTTFHNNFILNADYPFLMILMLIFIDFHHYKLPKDRLNLEIITEETRIT